MNETVITLNDCEALKRRAEYILRAVRAKHTAQETAAICGVSTITVGDICGTTNHPDRKRALYFVETAIKIIDSYEKNYNKKIIIKQNPDTKPKLWDHLPGKR